MARIAGVDLPNKQIVIALTYVYGIVRSAAKAICEKTKIDPHKMVSDLSQESFVPLLTPSTRLKVIFVRRLVLTLSV